MSRINDAFRVANLGLEKLLNVQPNERIAIMTDQSSEREHPEIIEMFRVLAHDRGAECVVISIADMKRGNEVIPQSALNVLESIDVLIALTRSTSASFRNKQAVELLDGKKIRILNMIQRSWDDFLSPTVMEANYEKMLKLEKDWAELVTNGSRIKVTSRQGTDFTASLEGMYPRIIDYAHKPGDFTNIVWAEVYFGPKEGTLNGRIVGDGEVLLYGKPSEPVVLDLKESRVIKISGGGSIGPALEKLIAETENADFLAEIALGVNEKVPRDEMPEIKKRLGTIHVAIGNGLMHGQRIWSPVHIDFALLHPSVWIDNACLLKDGVKQ